MGAAAAIITVRTSWPLISIPRIAAAFSRASNGFSASLTPPALPRPPTLTCALTTTLPPIFVAAASASSAVVAIAAAKTGTPCFSNKSRA